MQMEERWKGENGLRINENIILFDYSKPSTGLRPVTGSAMQSAYQEVKRQKNS